MAVTRTLDRDGFDRVRAFVRDAAGIAIGADRGNMISARLGKRLSITGHASLDDYLDFIEAGAVAERQHLISAMTTNVTHFFREPHHFDRLERIADSAFRAGRPMRVWTAGCSSGQEAYSIAFTLQQAGFTPRNARVLATDIDQAVLRQAMAADYSARDRDVLALSERGRAMLAAASGATVPATARAMVEFKPLNLIQAWPMRIGFDVVFCRNVAIYFDAETQAALWARLIGVLNPGGWLFIGHSERLSASVMGPLRYRGETSYQLGGADSEVAT